MVRDHKERRSLSNPLVFFDISIADCPIGRLVFELFQDVTPQTAENFRSLCTGERGLSPTSGIPLHYKGTHFHKIRRGYLAFGGSLGGESVYGGNFPDENFDLRHDSRGILATATKAPNENNSEFTISFRSTKSRNGKSVVFGQVVKGEGVLREIELIQPTIVGDKPALECMVVDCGEMESTDEVEALVDFPQDCPYPTFLADYHAPEGMTELEANLKVAMEIKILANGLYKAGDWLAASERYRQGLRYLDVDDFETSVDISDAQFNQLQELSSTLRVNRAMALIRCGRGVEAKMSCDVVLKYNTNPKALLRRGQAYLLLNQVDCALEDLKAAYQLLPKNQDVRNELERCMKLKKERQGEMKKGLARCFE